MRPQGEAAGAWQAWLSFGWRGRLAVVGVLALLVVVLLWLVDRRNESTSCGRLDQVLERVNSGEEGAFSDRTLADAEEISVKGLTEPGMRDIAVALSVGVMMARRDNTTTAFASAVKDYAVACGLELAPGSPWTLAP